MAKNSPFQSAMEASELGNRKSHGIAFEASELREGASGPLLHPRLVLAEQIGARRERLDELRVELFRKSGKRSVAQTVSGETLVAIALVFPKREPAVREIVQDLGSSHAEQGSDPARFDDRMDRRESTAPGAPQQAVQKGLGLVIAGVANRDTLTFEGVRRLVQEAVPRPPTCILQGSVRILRFPADVGSPRDERQAQLSSKLPTERLVLIRRGPQSVVQVRDDQLQAPLWRELREQMQQRHGIRAAGKADEDPVSRAEHAEFRDRGLHFSNDHDWEFRAGRLAIST